MAIALFYAALATSSPPAQSDPNTVVPPSFYQELRYRSIGPHRGGRVTAVAGVATAPKSNASYMAYERARADAEAHGGLPVPFHIRNAPTPLMKQMGYGRGYRYPHSEAADDQTYLPAELVGREYYEPLASGFEEELKARVDAARARRGKPPASPDPPPGAAESDG